MESGKMTGRARLLGTLRGQPVDRIPIAPFLYYNSVYEMFGHRPGIYDFYDPPDFDPIEKFVEYCDAYGFDVLHVLGSVWDMYLHSTLADHAIIDPDENWEPRHADEGAGDEIRRTLTIRTPGGDLRQVESYKRTSPYLIVQSIDEHMIKTRADFEIFRRHSPPADRMDLGLIRRAKAAVGDKGLLDTNTHGAFNILNMFRNLEQIFMDPITDEGFYREMMEFFLPRQLLRARKMVEAGAEVIEVAAQLAGSGVGPEFYRKYILEYERRLCRGLHEAGALVILHNCGRAKKIMHLYNEMEIDCWGYLTPPPFGDVELDEALRVMRPDLTLRGNIDQVEFMVKAMPAEVRKRVRDVVLKVKPRGRFILSTTDFFFDGVPPDNVRAFVQAGLDFGAY